MNAYMNVVRSYKRNDIDTSSPLRLVVLLYDGAIRFFRLSEKAYSEGDTGKARMYILRAEKIILELLSSLNFEEGGEIAENLANLYRFIIGHCAEINETNYQEIIGANCKILTGLREAWSQLEREPNPE